MKRKNLPFKKFVKYLREVSVVVIGVAITLFASYWITNRNEKKDVALYLNAIKLELADNVRVLSKQKEFFQKEVEYANYLKSNDKKSVNLDTIFTYHLMNVWSLNRPNCNTYAFEMFKQSGTMRLIDKELLLLLWKAYSSLDLVKNNLFEEGFQIKTKEVRQEWSLISQTIKDRKLTTIPMYNYYCNTFESENMLQNCSAVLELLEKTVLRLE